MKRRSAIGIILIILLGFIGLALFLHASNLDVLLVFTITLILFLSVVSAILPFVDLLPRQGNGQRVRARSPPRS